MNAGVPEVINSVVDGMKGQPVAIALIVINLIFLGVFYLLINSVNARTATELDRNDKLVLQLIAQCAPGAKN
jgi:hypothetical protein